MKETEERKRERTKREERKEEKEEEKKNSKNSPRRRRVSLSLPPRPSPKIIPGSGWDLVYYAGVLEALQQAGALDPLASRMSGLSGGSVAAATSGAGLSGKQMFDVVAQTLNTCEPASCQIALAAVFRALLPPDVGTVYGDRVTIFMTRLNAVGAAGGVVSGVASPKTALIRTSSPAKNSSFAASSPAAAAIATQGRNWPSAADIADEKLHGASPWPVSTFTSPSDVVGAVSSSSFLPCWSAPLPFYVYKNKPVIDGGFSTDFGMMCAAALNGTKSGTECVRVAASGILGPNVKPGNNDRSGRSCEIPSKKKKLSLRKLLQMGVLPKAALAAEDAWLSEIDRSLAAEYPAVQEQQQQQQQQVSSEGSDDGAGEGSSAAAASARLNPLTESLTTLSFAVASAVSNATAAAAAGSAGGTTTSSTPTLPETTPLCPKKEAFTFSWPRLVNQTEAGGSAPSIYPGKFAGSPLPFTVCEWQKLVLSLAPAVLPKVYAAGLADAAEWATANGFCGANVGK